MESTSEEISPPAPNGQDEKIGGDPAASDERPEKAPARTAQAAPAEAAVKVETARKAPAAQVPPPDIAPRDPVQVNLRTLLQAGVHFGHQTSRWNPAAAEYIYGVRNGIHIISLPKTLQCWEKARACIVEVVSKGGAVLFVGTKKQAEEAVVEEARRCGAYYVSRRWLGGMLTNFQTIRKSISRLNKIEEILAEEDKASKEGTPTRYTKKERLMMSREHDKLEFSLGGIREMYSPPQLMFIIDIKREDIAVKEAKRIDIPVVALVDTNCDPAVVTHPIPSNDDGTRAIRLFCAAVADAVMEGKKAYTVVRKDHDVAHTSHGRRRGHEAPSAAEGGEPKANGEREVSTAQLQAAEDLLARAGIVSSD